MNYVKLRDSIVNKKNIELIANITESYNSAEKDKQITHQKLELQTIKTESVKDQRFLIILFSIIGCVASIAWIVFLNYRNKLLKKARAKALQASEAKSQFLDVMTHELRTPLHTISGSLFLLQEERNAKEKEESIQSIKFASDYLNNLVENTIIVKALYDKSDKHKVVKSKPVSFALYNLIEEVSKSIRLNDNGNQIISDLDKTIPKKLIGPKLDLTRILISLINNANKFTRGGVIKVKAIGEKKLDDSWAITFCVTDNGVGISKKEQEKVFNEFYTGEKFNNHNEYIGLGLGLNLVKRILELYDTNAILESKLGVGTSISFTLNFNTDNTVDDTPDLKKENINTIETKILLVEDNKVNQIMTKRIIEKLGYTCHIAENGKIAVKKYKEVKYALVLMDIMMPIMDGFEAAIKIYEFDKKAKIVAVTAMAIEGNEQKFNEANIKNIIPKPVNFHELDKAIKLQLN